MKFISMNLILTTPHICWLIERGPENTAALWRPPAMGTDLQAHGPVHRSRSQGRPGSEAPTELPMSQMAATHSPLTLRSIANPKSLSLQLSQQGWRKDKPPEWGPGVADHLSPLTKTAHAGQAGAESAKDGPEQNRPRFPGGQRRGAVGSGAEAQPFGPPLRLRRSV